MSSMNHRWMLTSLKSCKLEPGTHNPHPPCQHKTHAFLLEMSTASCQNLPTMATRADSLGQLHGGCNWFPDSCFFCGLPQTTSSFHSSHSFNSFGGLWPWMHSLWSMLFTLWFHQTNAIGLGQQHWHPTQDHGCFSAASYCLLGLFPVTVVHPSTTSFCHKCCSMHAALPLISCCLSTANHQTHKNCENHNWLPWQ